MNPPDLDDLESAASDRVGADLRGLPSGFVWGAATAAFQIEGDAAHRGESIWDRMCAEPGRIIDGSDGKVACDHVNRYRQDVGLMRELGLDAYRFSFSWPRLQPEGRGPLAPSGLDFYDRLVDALLEAGIEPWATQYHWDLPAPLQELGGWANREIADWFTDYAVAIHAALGDRVRHWATLNEPWCSAWLGYGSGEHAPGIRNHARATRAAHHLLLAHGRAVAGMRAQAPADHRLGIVLNLFPVRPHDGAPAGSRDTLDLVAARMDGVQNRWWLDALFAGGYPADTLDLLAPYLDSVIAQEDFAEIAQPLDFLGVNYYNDTVILPSDPPTPDDAGAYPGAGRARIADPGPDATSMGWPVTPEGLRQILLRITAEYPQAPPLVITENGSAWADPITGPDPDDPAGESPVPDPQRVSYLLRHVEATAAAARDGVDVRGYFAWSLLDNFEWAHGYTQRFGLVQVDYATQRRRPRQSYHTYQELIAAQRMAVNSRTEA